MANYTIGIDLVATDEATPAITEAQGSLLELDKQQETAAQSTQKLTEETGKSSQAFGQFKSELTNVITAWGLFQVAGKVVEVMQLGGEVRQASATFTQLAGGAGAAATMLDALQTSTHGIVDNMTLMNGANRLMLMGLADTSDEVSQLTNLAVTLGRAMGHDAGQSIEDFAALLANQSIPRLDNFGISSDNVRKKIEQLKDSGYGAQEAFKMAVLSEGATAIAKLGDAATSAISPMERLGTTAKNILEDIASRARLAVDSMVGIAEIATGQNPIQIASREQAEQAGKDFAAQWSAAATDALRSAGITDAAIENMGGSDFINQLMAKAYAAYQQNPSVNFMDIVMESGLDTGQIAIYGKDIADTLQNAVVSGFNTTAVADKQSAELARLNAAQSAMWADVSRQHQDSYYTAYTQFWRAKGATTQGDNNPLLQALTMTPEQAQASAEHLRDVWAQAAEQSAVQAAADTSFQTMMQGMMDFSADKGNVPKFLDPTAAQAYSDELTKVQSQYEYMAALNESGLISDDDLNAAKALRDNVADMADEAQKAADNLANLKLPDLFGQTSGGIGGQITDDLVKQMEASGQYTADQIKEIQHNLDMQSGRETSASTVYQQDVVPMLADIGKLSPDDMAKAVQNLTTFMQMAAQKELTPDQIAQLMPMATGYGYTGQGGQQFTIKPGQTPGEIAAQMGIPLDQVLAAAGAPNARGVVPGTYQLGNGVQALPGFSLEGLFAGKEGVTGEQGGVGSLSLMSTALQDMAAPSQSLADNFTSVKDSSTEATKQAIALGDTLDKLTKKTNIVDVQLNIGGLDALKALFGGAMSGTSPTKVRDNGGQVTGVDVRTAQ